MTAKVSREPAVDPVEWMLGVEDRVSALERWMFWVSVLSVLALAWAIAATAAILT